MGISQTTLRPIIKWAGGKRQLLHKLLSIVPAHNNYYEPFFGGGALLLGLQPKHAIVSDINAQLINLYNNIKFNADDLIDCIQTLDTQNIRGSEYYYELRSKYNDKLLSNTIDIESAALFLWLNKHCFNGLYRIGTKGNFNVPYNGGTALSADPIEIRALSLYFRSIEFYCQDFELTCSTVESGDLVFLDPPYVPVNTVGVDINVAMYTQTGFDLACNQRLANLTRRLNDLGAYFILTNHDVPIIRQLYSGFNIETVSVHRNINRDGNNRRGTEVIITNFKY